ncbi:hypothetical protein VTO42DRAFT_6639 [Malbranchea cinnamomea]
MLVRLLMDEESSTVADLSNSCLVVRGRRRRGVQEEWATGRNPWKPRDEVSMSVPSSVPGDNTRSMLMAKQVEFLKQTRD